MATKKSKDWSMGRADEMEREAGIHYGVRQCALQQGKLVERPLPKTILLHFFNLVPSYPAFSKEKGYLHERCMEPFSLHLDDPRKLERKLEQQSARSTPVSTRIDRSIDPYTGLRNVGNTCYLNCLLQYLFVNTAFRKAIIEASHRPDDAILQALQLLFCSMQLGCQRVCDPSAFVDAAQLVRGEQEDVTEMWRILIMYLHQISHGSITDLISFKESLRTNCKGCNQDSQRTEDFNELTVLLKPAAAGAASETGIVDVEAAPASKNRVVDLEAELADSFRSEHLYGENQYFCDKCARLHNADRNRGLLTVPRFLHIVVSRSFYDPEKAERKKVCDEIRYPEVLDLAPFFCKSQEERRWRHCRFELIAVLEHHSQVSDSGHYKAVLRQPLPAKPEDGWSLPRWWCFNDSKVAAVVAPGTPAEPPATDRTCNYWSSAAAYMLAYRRISDDSGQELKYCEPDIINIPPMLREAVAANDEKVKDALKDVTELENQRQAMIIQRIEQIRALPDKLLACHGIPIEECSVLPTLWLRRWEKCDEVNTEDLSDLSLRVDYSDALLPTDSGYRLDPLDLWSANPNVKVVPTKLLREIFFAGLDSGRVVNLVPKGIDFESLSIEKLIEQSKRMPEAVSNLLRSSREMTTLLAKIRDGNGHHEAQVPEVLVRQTVVTQLSTHYGNLHQPWKGRGRRRSPWYPNSWELLSALVLQSGRYRRIRRKLRLCCNRAATDAPQRQEIDSPRSSGMNRPSSDDPGVFDLSSGLACQHGLLLPRFQTLFAEKSDVARLTVLAEQISKLWSELGRVDTITIVYKQPLAATTVECDVCRLQLKEDRKARRVQLEELKQTRRKEQLQQAERNQPLKEEQLAKRPRTSSGGASSSTAPVSTSTSSSTAPVSISSKASTTPSKHMCLTVLLLDERNRSTTKQTIKQNQFEITLPKGSSGLSIKQRIVEEAGGLKADDVGCLLLFAAGASVGDGDKLFEDLPEEKPMIAELHDQNLGSSGAADGQNRGSPQKTHASALQNCRLLRGSEIGAPRPEPDSKGEQPQKRHKGASTGEEAGKRIMRLPEAGSKIASSQEDGNQGGNGDGKDRAQKGVETSTLHAA